MILEVVQCLSRYKELMSRKLDLASDLFKRLGWKYSVSKPVNLDKDKDLN